MQFKWRTRPSIKPTRISNAGDVEGGPPDAHKTHAVESGVSETHKLAVVKHYVSGIQRRQCDNPGTLIGTEVDNVLSMDREYLFMRVNL